MNIFEKKNIVVLKDLDENKHVNNVVYVQWIQDVADAHWKQLTIDISTSNMLWFVLRHEIDYMRQAKLNDLITIKTWVGKTEGVKSVRHVEIKRGEELLVKSETTFCLLDAITSKPKRIPKEIIEILVPK